ncbi:MAG TPA: hypothetical protein VNG33_00670, partial [Polyangiaceae bacterium]|nr:hypothetical protein [Polyangiaceae bacterium]
RMAEGPTVASAGAVPSGFAIGTVEGAPPEPMPPDVDEVPGVVVPGVEVPPGVGPPLARPTGPAGPSMCA